MHFLNQFFGQIGGEEKANTPLQVVGNPVGPGAALQKAIEGQGTIVATVISGDNFFIEEKEKAIAGLNRAFEEYAPDIVLAGPAFNAGRYGLACGEVCKAAQSKGIPAVTAMYPENPGVLEHRREIYIFPTRERPSDMVAAIEKMANFAFKLVKGEPIGSADEEGYLPRGKRRSSKAAVAGYKRAVDMLSAKVHGKPFKTEIPILLPERVKPAPPLSDVSKAEIAMVTTCGLIRKGNPEGQVPVDADRYFRHSVEGLSELTNTDWEAYHSGYYDEIASDDPNYILPLRQMRFLESEGKVARIHPWIFTLAGCGTPVAKAKKIGEGIAKELVDGGVDGCLLTSA
jgi:glycine reductase